MRVEVKPTPNRGLGLFAAQDFDKGAFILSYNGPLVSKDTKPNFQVGANTFMGPDGTAADACNHACSPNAWVLPGKPCRIHALRPITAGEEFGVDYALTHTTDEPFFQCLCGAINCRGTVSGFGTVPPWQQLRYLKMGIVPRYVLDFYLPELLGR